MVDSNGLDYYVFFMPGFHNYKWMLKDGFGHIGIIIDDGEKLISIDPSYEMLMINSFDYKNRMMALDKILQDENKIVVKVKCINNAGTSPRYGILNMINCVTAVKYILGIKRFIHTPFSVYKYLMNIWAGEDSCLNIVDVQPVGVRHNGIRK